jgi:hypothetical protein
VGHGRQEGVTVDSAREIAGVCTFASQHNDLLGRLEDSGLAVPHAGVRGR